MSTNRAAFLEGSILRHISIMSASSGAGLLAIFLVDFADLFFISLLGEDALAAAVGYAGTVLFFFTSIGIGLAIAMGALTARALGKEDPDRARAVAGSIAAIIVTIGIALTVMLMIFAPTFLTWLGATGEAHDFATSYLRIAGAGTPFLMLGMAGGAVLRSHGDARRAMNTTLSSAFANAALDPLFIFGFGWGLDGAAVATLIARITLAVVAWRPIIMRYDGVARPRIGTVASDLAPVFAIAGPALLTNVATPVGNAFITRMISSFGTEAVAGYAVIGRLTPLAFCLIFGLSGAVGPIIGQNFGAGQMDRVRETLVKALILATAYVALVSIALFLLRVPLADLFRASDEARTLLFLFCGPLSLAFAFNAALFTTNAAFNNLDSPLTSTAINWGRHTLGTIPFAWVGAQMMGAEGVLIGQYAGGAIFAVIGVWLAFRLVEKHEPTVSESDRTLSDRLPQSPFSNWRP
jgi:putative MATE family efflux protein